MKDDTLALAKLRAEELLTFFGVNTTAKVSETDGGIAVEVDTDASGRLIGHRGETLRALQYLLTSLVRAGADEPLRLSLDIAGYKKAREEALRAQAEAAAAKVIATGSEVRLRPMTAGERRIVHMALAETAGITTESEGEDPHRRLVIKKEQAEA